MFTVSNEVNPIGSTEVKPATESVTETVVPGEEEVTESSVDAGEASETEEVVEDVDNTLDESDEEEFEEDGADTADYAVESLMSSKNGVDDLISKVAKKAAKKKTAKSLDELESAIDTEIKAFNAAMKTMKNAASDFAEKKITKAELTKIVNTAQDSLKAKLKILSIGDFETGTDVSSEDIKQLKKFLVGAKKAIAERRAVVGTEAKEEEAGEATESKTKATEGDACCDDWSDDEWDEAYEAYSKKSKASESTEKKPLTREEFKMAMSSDMVKRDADLRNAIGDGEYTRAKLEKMGILKATEAKAKKDVSNLTKSTDEKKKGAVESFTQFLDEMEIDADAIATEAATKLKTTWKIKHGALRKEATAMKRQAGKFVSEKKFDEAYECIEGARKALKDIDEQIDGLDMSDYRSLTPGSEENEKAFKAYKEKLRAWVENELSKLDTYKERIEAKEGKKPATSQATESATEVESELDAALESFLESTETEETTEEEETVEEEQTETVEEEVVDEDFEYDTATESYVALDMDNVDADLELELAIMQ